MPYYQKYPCPTCKSLNTWSTTLATTRRWLSFDCIDCGHQFRKQAANISSVSRRLSQAVKENPDLFSSR